MFNNYNNKRLQCGEKKKKKKTMSQESLRYNVI